MSKEIRQSETVVISRKLINFAPYNPKHHSQEAVAQIKKNFKDKGFLGGVVWNEVTGNLVSGHKRIMAMDLVYGYNGENDYDVKVEKVTFTIKEEKEQNIFMDSKGANTPQDYKLIADILPDIDYKAAGLSDADMNMIAVLSPNFSSIEETKSVVDDYKELARPFEERKQEIKELKKAIQQKVEDNYTGDPFITITFDSFENKAFFCELLKIDQYQKYAKGEVLTELIESMNGG